LREAEEGIEEESILQRVAPNTESKGQTLITPASSAIVLVVATSTMALRAGAVVTPPGFAK